MNTLRTHFCALATLVVLCVGTMNAATTRTAVHGQLNGRQTRFVTTMLTRIMPEDHDALKAALDAVGYHFDNSAGAVLGGVNIDFGSLLSESTSSKAKPTTTAPADSVDKAMVFVTSYATRKAIKYCQQNGTFKSVNQTLIDNVPGYVNVETHVADAVATVVPQVVASCVVAAVKKVM